MSDPCPHCGLVHQETCPRIKAIEYFETGATKRVEFHEPVPMQWPPTGPVISVPQIDLAPRSFVATCEDDLNVTAWNGATL